MAGTTFGRAVLGTVGGSLQASADGRPEMKSGGVTIDWSLVTAVAADTTYEDGVLVSNGEKALRFGQVVTAQGVSEVQTVTLANATGGTFTLTLPAGADATLDPAQTTVALAYNASADVVAAALNALTRLAPDGVTVSLAGSAYTVTFARRLGNVPQLTATDSTTGAGHSITMATTTAGTGGTAWGPYDPAATDGRQTLARGFVGVVNETVKENDLKSAHPPTLVGGKVFKNRLIATNGTAALATGPTFTALEAAMPRLSYEAD